MNIPTFDEYKLLPKEQRRAIREYQKQNGLEVYPGHKGIPSILRGRPNYNNRGPRGEYPQNWIVGPDPVRHDKYIAYHRHRAQAHFRGEDYALTFSDFEHIWQDQWPNRGRQNHNMVLTRIDPELPWCRGNIELITRLERIQRNGRERVLRNQ